MDSTDFLADFRFKTTVEIRFSDLDLLGHVNNAVYLTYFEQARLAYSRNLTSWNWKKTGVVVAKSEVEYLKPVFLDDKIEVYIRTSRIGNTSFELEYVISLQKPNEKAIITTKGKTLQVVIDMKTNKPIPIPEAIKNQIITFERRKL